MVLSYVKNMVKLVWSKECVNYIVLNNFFLVDFELVFMGKRKYKFGVKLY